MNAAQTGHTGTGPAGPGKTAEGRTAEAKAGNGGSPKDAAREVGREAQAEARRLRDEAVEGVRRQADQQKHATGRYLHTLASAVGSGAEAFRRDGQETTGALLDRAAEEIGNVADRVDGQRPEEILRDVEGFARRHPVVFFGSAALLAFGATRLLRSSSPDDQGSDGRGYGSGSHAAVGTPPGPTSVGIPPGASRGSPAGGAAVATPPSGPGPTGREVQ